MTGAHDGGSSFPTVRADPTPDLRTMTGETLGPVVGVMPFADLEDAIRLANDSISGLAAFAFTRDLARGLRLAGAFGAGSVWINDVHRRGQAGTPRRSRRSRRFAANRSRWRRRSGRRLLVRRLHRGRSLLLACRERESGPAR
nr:aldehyde dehydrogenase family protein [Deinococcus aestuarii]